MTFVAGEQCPQGATIGWVVPVSNDKLLQGCEPWCPLSAQAFSMLGFKETQIKERIFLGYWNGEPCEAVELAPACDTSITTSNVDWLPLRPLLDSVPEELFQLGARAVQLIRWLREHKFCGVCGSETRSARSDRALVCTACEQRFYPKIAPCVMILVTRGDECLLANGVRHREGLYTALAGFIEAGETAEEAGLREVMEEVGLELGSLTYFGTQSWPFPGQLMIAYTAEYRAGDICIDKKEIVDANWYRYDKLPTIPTQSTIAGRLIRHFVSSKGIVEAG